ncbi:MAG: FAD-dependent oxidoreductase [Pseudonocardiaceae bacterium]
MVALDGHNWNTDRSADGGWAGYPAGLPSRYLTRMREPEGRLVFAGSDIAPIASGWIEGAIESGTIAGCRAASLLTHSNRSMKIEEHPPLGIMVRTGRVAGARPGPGGAL